jgi:hypothetical protein
MRALLLLALVVFVALSSAAHGAVVRVFPQLGAVLNSDFSPTDASAIVSADLESLVLVPRAEKYIIQIDVLMRIDDLQAGQLGFGNAAFNILLEPGLGQSLDLPGWQPFTNECQTWCPGPGVKPLWADNGDFGPSGSDLQSIVVGTAPRDFGNLDDPRRTLGIAPYHNPPNSNLAGQLIGNIYLELDGDAGQSGIEVVAVQASSYDSAGTMSTANMIGIGGRVGIQVVPEPSTAMTLGLGVVSVLFCLRKCRSRPQYYI